MNQLQIGHIWHPCLRPYPAKESASTRTLQKGEMAKVAEIITSDDALRGRWEVVETLQQLGKFLHLSAVHRRFLKRHLSV